MRCEFCKEDIMPGSATIKTCCLASSLKQTMDKDAIEELKKYLK